MAFNLTGVDHVDAAPLDEHFVGDVRTNAIAFNGPTLEIRNIVDVADRSRGRCLGVLENKVTATVFHFEPHQSVLGPEYFGLLQNLADHVTVCPGITVVLTAVGEHKQTNEALRQKREESVLRLLDRKGYNMSQFRAGHRIEEENIVRSSFLDGSGNGSGRIEFTVRQNVSAEPIQEERIGKLSQ